MWLHALNINCCAWNTVTLVVEYTDWNLQAMQVCALKMIDMIPDLIAYVTNIFLIDRVNEIQALKLQMYESATYMKGSGTSRPMK